jgi:uncharacterized protein
MNIIVFGASGKLGGRVVELALERGHNVTAFVHNAEIKMQHDLLRITRGDARDLQTVTQALTEHQGVVSALGSRHDDTLTKGVETIIDGMKRHGIQRLITTGAAGILQANETQQVRDLPSFPPFLKEISGQHNQAYKIVKDSGLAWTVLCPPSMHDSVKAPYKIQAEYTLGGLGQVAFEQVAETIMNELEHPQFINQRVAITT